KSQGAAGTAGRRADVPAARCRIRHQRHISPRGRQPQDLGAPELTPRSKTTGARIEGVAFPPTYAGIGISSVAPDGTQPGIAFGCLAAYGLHADDTRTASGFGLLPKPVVGMISRRSPRRYRAPGTFRGGAASLVVLGTTPGATVAGGSRCPADTAWR